MDKNAKIYVAGHRGLVGSAILRLLQKRGYTNLALKTSDELDLRDQQAVAEFFAKEKPEYVILAAAKVGGIVANNRYRADFIYENLAIQNNVIHQSYLSDVKKLLFLGSSCIYPKEAPQPITENALLTSPLEYTNEPYAIAKIAGIKMIESYNIQYGTNYLAVMPTNLYGPNDNYDLEKSHVMPALIRKILLAKFLEIDDWASINSNLGPTELESKKKLEQLGINKKNNKVEIKVWGTGRPRREFLHVDDMAAACVFVLENLNFNDVKGNDKDIRNTHLNVGCNSDISIAELTELIKDIIGFNGAISYDTSKPDGTMQKLMSSAKLNSLGWEPTIKLEDGIRQTVKQYMSGNNA